MRHSKKRILATESNLMNSHDLQTTQSAREIGVSWRINSCEPTLPEPYPQKQKLPALKADRFLAD